MVPFIDILGYWIGIFITFCILSYLYKDNPFYKFAEHLFVGVSLGVVLIQQWYDTLRPNLIDPLFHPSGNPWFKTFGLVMAVFLVLMMFLKAASERFAWLGKYPIAFVVALYAGININSYGQADLAEQIKVSTRPIVKDKLNINEAKESELAGLPGFSPLTAKAVIAEREKGHVFHSLDELETLSIDPQRPEVDEVMKRELKKNRGSLVGLDAKASTKSGRLDWFEMFSRFFLLVGLVASLWYFNFSIEQKGVMGKVAKFGVWVLMIGFGASFGMTVQGRLALAVGRAVNVIGKDKAPELARQIRGPIVAVISMLIIGGGIAAWEVWQKRRKPPAPPPPPEEDLPAF